MPDSTKFTKTELNPVSTSVNTVNPVSVPSTVHPVGSTTLVDAPSGEVLVSSESNLQKIERILRDGGMDTMSVIKALQAIDLVLKGGK